MASIAVRTLETIDIEHVHQFISTALIPKSIIEWNNDKDSRRECASETLTLMLFEDGLLREQGE